MQRRSFAIALLSFAVAAGGTLAIGVADAEAADTSLKDMMKKMGAVAAGDDAKPLAVLFVATKGKSRGDAELAGWDAIAEKGRVAAEAGDLAGAKATCGECHKAYRDKFKAKYGSKAP
ncbi:MAG: hypothetical protein KF901_03010 [Myxococcales bacterium]|nr:hypothetical protein [Myxococcales bacterium]